MARSLRADILLLTSWSTLVVGVASAADICVDRDSIKRFDRNSFTKPFVSPRDGACGNAGDF